MKVSLKWLKDYVDVTVSPEELAEMLTMVGLEASDVTAIGEEWGNVFVGEVLGIEKHPNADRLCLATVTLGYEQHTVVCGAPNIAAGQKVAFAKVGARLFNPYAEKVEELKPAKIRGVRSEGMICSEKELQISENHEGIMVLDSDAPIGKPLAEYMGDVIFEVTVTPNRPDCLNMIGIAREVAALTGAELKLPQVQYEESDIQTDDLISIEIQDPDLCARYCGAVIQNVRICPSPRWMQERLISAGMRPINNIVDITNFVMLEYGQPLHAFDYDLLGGRKIIVRRAREGEVMYTLDGEERSISPEMLVIADATHPVAVAGVMGGAESEVTEGTTTILLESANFNNVSIRRTSRALGLITESSSRFDKGLSAELPMPAARRAVQLMVALSGGKATRGIVDVYPGRSERQPVRLTEQRVNQVLGVGFGLPKIKSTLESLGFICREEGPSGLSVTVPYWRTDVSIPEDLIEEVARIIGYDEIPTMMLSGEIPQHEPTAIALLKTKIQDILVGCGMQEIITYAMTSQDILEKTHCVEKCDAPQRVANPLSREQEFLRVSLRGGLLLTFASNERHHDKGIMLFELGRVYLPRDGELPEEKEMLCGILGGSHLARSWHGEAYPIDFFHAKGILETLFGRLGMSANFEPDEDSLLLSGRTARISVNGTSIGIIGEIHPDVLADFDIESRPVCLFDIDLGKMIPHVDKFHTFRSIPRYPSIDRDLALVVDIDLPARKIQDIICNFPQVKEAILFDVYQGKQIPEGKKSLAFALRYQSMDRTLTDDEVDKIQDKILKRLEKEAGAMLRK